MRLGKPSFISWTTIILVAILSVFIVYTVHAPFRGWLNGLGGGIIGSAAAALGNGWASLTAHPIWVSYIGAPKPLALAIFFLIGLLVAEFVVRRRMYEPIRQRVFRDTRVSDLGSGTAIIQQGGYNPLHTTPMAPATPANPEQKENES
jgi:hypothetical protein